MTTILTEADLRSLAPPIEKIRVAVEAGLTAHAKGNALSEPTVSFKPNLDRSDMITVVRGSLPLLDLALVKTVGGFPQNASKGLATNPGSLMVIETQTGQVVGLLPAATLTTQRTAMVSAIGAKHLGSNGPSVIGCIGTGGISVQAVRFISQMMEVREIRLHGRSKAHTEQVAVELSEELSVNVQPAIDWVDCFKDADILIDGAARSDDTEEFPVSAIRSGSLTIGYSAYSSFPLGSLKIFDELYFDRWTNDGLGAVGPHMRAAEIDAKDVTDLVGHVVGQLAYSGSNTARRLFVHRGLAACDLLLAQLYLAEAKAKGIGVQINL